MARSLAFVRCMAAALREPYPIASDGSPCCATLHLTHLAQLGIKTHADVPRLTGLIFRSPEWRSNKGIWRFASSGPRECSNAAERRGRRKRGRAWGGGLGLRLAAGRCVPASLTTRWHARTRRSRTRRRRACCFAQGSHRCREDRCVPGGASSGARAGASARRANAMPAAASTVAVTWQSSFRAHAPFAGKQDPYCVLTCGTYTHRSKTHTGERSEGAGAYAARVRPGTPRKVEVATPPSAVSCLARIGRLRGRHVGGMRTMAWSALTRTLRHARRASPAPSPPHGRTDRLPSKMEELTR
eukprot:364253-Chlamydomonas_euryale.AAC.4